MRQLCNVAYTVLSEGRDEREQEELDISLGMVPDPDEEALKMLADYQRSIGREAVDPATVPRAPRGPDADEKL